MSVSVSQMGRAIENVIFVHFVKKLTLNPRYLYE